MKDKKKLKELLNRKMERGDLARAVSLEMEELLIQIRQQFESLEVNNSRERRDKSGY